MRLTIVKEDNTVIIDGIVAFIDCSHLPPWFHALQWYGDYGEIEVIDPDKPHHHCIENRRIDGIADYQTFVDQHAAIMRAIEEAKAKAVPKAEGAVNVIT